MTSKIITKNGAIVPLADWQKTKGLLPHKVGEYFFVNEFSPNFVLHETLFEILDKVREAWGKPIKINSSYRTAEHQKSLIASGVRAATNSPHTWGLAIDVDTATAKESREMAQLIMKIVNSFGMVVRVGYLKYIKEGQTFVHFDICPLIFGSGGVWEYMPTIPQEFKTLAIW